MKTLHLALVGVLSISTLGAHENKNAEKFETEHSVRDVVKNIVHTNNDNSSMVALGKLSGQIRTMYVGYHQHATADTYATAIGAFLDYESMHYKGFNLGAELEISKDLNFASGERSLGKNNPELSSTDGKYTELSQAYLNYKYDNLDIIVGRMLIDTPLADSDDIFMIHNTFSGAVASYEYKDATFMVGHLSKWQGTDAGLDEPWVKTSDSGTNFGGISYTGDLEFNVWYYNITKVTNALYGDIGYTYHLNSATDLHGGMQYLHEKELSGSGIKADIYGAYGEAIIGNATLTLAYNYAAKNQGKDSFSGLGGGTLYTNTEKAILNDITNDRSASAFVAGVAYTINDVNLLYAYGDFDGNADSFGIEKHIVEQDIIVDYTYNDFVLSLTHSISQDRKNAAKTSDDWERTQVFIAYNF